MATFILSKGCISLMISGKMYQIRESNKNYEAVKKGLKTLSDKDLLDLVDTKAHMASAFKTIKIEFKDGLVYANDLPISSILTDRYAQLVKEGMPVENYEHFIENVYKNPSIESVKDLYAFMEACDLPITDDGCFLAYKRIKKDWTDCHTGRISNRVGSIVKMSRKDVDADRNQSCSTGLHVCSRSYLGHFSGDRLIMVKVNPINVVSVPTDYHAAKMRVCEYEVVEELKSEDEMPKNHVNLKDNDKDDSGYVDPALVDKSDLAPDVETALSSIRVSADRQAVLQKLAHFDKYIRDRNIPEDFYEKLDAVNRRGLYRCVERIIGGHTIKGSIPKIREVKDTISNLRLTLAQELVHKANKK